MEKAVVLLLVIISSHLCMGGPSITRLSPPSLKKSQTAPSPGLDLCPTCITFAEDALNDLLNIILNAGVVGGCNELCQLLYEKIPSQLVELACNFLCDYVGIKEFINMIENADLDPIYYCELLKLCPVFDHGDAHILSLKVLPDSVPRGDKFVVTMIFDTMNGTGTGEIDFLIQTVDGIPVGNNDLSEPLAPGSYNVTWHMRAKPDPNCDPTQNFCEEWVPGNYTAQVAICNGECGSKHPHSQVYDTGSAPFRVVEKN